MLLVMAVPPSEARKSLAERLRGVSLKVTMKSTLVRLVSPPLPTPVVVPRSMAVMVGAVLSST